MAPAEFICNGYVERFKDDADGERMTAPAW